MRKIVGPILIVALCLVILGIAIVTAEFEMHELGYFLILGVGVAVYHVTRWMRGPGSELGTPVPSLNLAERELDEESASPQR